MPDTDRQRGAAGNSTRRASTSKDMKTKICTRCHLELPATTEYFSLRKSRKKSGYIWRGFNSRCITCIRMERKSYYMENRDKILNKNRDYLKEHPDRAMAAIKKWLKKHPEKAKQYSKNNYHRHKSKRVEGHRRWKKANAEHVRIYNRNAKAKRRQAEGRFTVHDINRIYDEQKGLCAYCGKKLDGNYHVDHVMPICRGGSNWPENLALSCPTCNLRKREKTAEEFLAILQLEKTQSQPAA